LDDDTFIGSRPALQSGPVLVCKLTYLNVSFTGPWIIVVFLFPIQKGVKTLSPNNSKPLLAHRINAFDELDKSSSVQETLEH